MANGSKLLRNTRIQDEVARIRRKAEDTAGSTVMALVETLEFLTSVVRTPVGHLTPDDPLTQDYLEEHNAFGLKKRIRGCCKLKAIETLSRLTGRFQDTLKLESDRVVQVTIGD